MRIKVVLWLLSNYPLLFSGGSNGKESAYNGGDQGLTPGLGRQMKMSPVGYSPWVHKESDTTALVSCESVSN